MLDLKMRTFVFDWFEDFSIWRETHMSSSHHVIITTRSSPGMTSIDDNIHHPILADLGAQLLEILVQLVVQKMAFTLINASPIELVCINRYDGFIPTIFFIAVEVFYRLTMSREMEVNNISLFTSSDELFQLFRDLQIGGCIVNDCRYLKTLFL